MIARELPRLVSGREKLALALIGRRQFSRDIDGPGLLGFPKERFHSLTLANLVSKGQQLSRKRPLERFLGFASKSPADQLLDLIRSGYRAWIRTMNNASKGRCVTVTPRGKSEDETLKA